MQTENPDLMHFPQGVITANLTPLHDDLSVNFELLVEHCHKLLEQGSDGLAVLGTTGEASSFSVHERKQILEHLHPFDRRQIMLGTGCCSYQDTIELTQHGLDHGITNFLMLPPYYYKQVDDLGLLQYFDRVIRAIGTKEMRIYLYHFPKLAGVSFSDNLVAKLVKTFPETIVGMKDSTGDWTHMRHVLDTVPGFRLYAGTETYLLESLKHSGCGCISATANVTCGLAAKALKSWAATGDEGAHTRLVKIRKAFEGLPFTGALKAFLAQSTGNRSWLNVRPPNRLIEDQDLQSLLRKLDALEFGLA